MQWHPHLACQQDVLARLRQGAKGNTTQQGPVQGAAPVISFTSEGGPDILMCA